MRNTPAVGAGAADADGGAAATAAAVKSSLRGHAKSFNCLHRIWAGGFFPRRGSKLGRNVGRYAYPSCISEAWWGLAS